MIIVVICLGLMYFSRIYGMNLSYSLISFLIPLKTRYHWKAVLSYCKTLLQWATMIPLKIAPRAFRSSQPLQLMNQLSVVYSICNILWRSSSAIGQVIRIGTAMNFHTRIMWLFISPWFPIGIPNWGQSVNNTIEGFY